MSQRPLNCASSAKRGERASNTMTGVRTKPNLSQCRQLFQTQPAGVNRHADGGVDVHGLERAYFIERGDAARGGDLERCSPPQATEPFEIRTLQHAFFIDVGAQDAGAKRLELSCDLLRG